MKPGSFRIIVLQEEGMFVAQGLEHDICVQAEDMDTLARRFVETVDLEGEEIDQIEPAPAHFHEMWDGATELAAHHIDDANVRLAA